MVVLVTGAGGQLGQAIQSISVKHTEIDFVFCDSSMLDITDKEKCQRVFEKYRPKYCINTAAYTAVDLAEMEPERAFEVNVNGVENLVSSCLEMETVLIHLSTDFVFDGLQKRPYSEDDLPNPQTVYGKTKWEGENVISKRLKKYYIVRTSWVYSDFGHNFMKTMQKLAKTQQEINIVNDQIGTPTHAVDLAGAIIEMISKDDGSYGIYNYSSAGACSWYEFVLEIFKVQNIKTTVHPISSLSYPTLAIRPKYSVLDKKKINNKFGVVPPLWQASIPKL
ncbi:dTDP-4-dehydrorhamnose reductase [Flavobacterium sp. NKUCC04_CG]|uniref:dTDP-4-dehydrorhamnose reductase n=1 Tax=Flavobacterium sp. NKUCC04_CG TaxID=2842121 RepID=UPI001C5B48BA|nr:dTDP-4-dehydrorhamnose reductase [Flavobacterium sp. NKUCC04_CG]MBW3518874.1 dTDP-4-dehydrorhamnose reductase [Flavobacterium sp. NKUCC04_CG]